MSLIRNYLSEYIWDLALGSYSDAVITKGIDWSQLHYVNNPYKKKWFADPFILSEDNVSVQLLVEEFDSDVKKGRIARIVISKENFTIIECHIVLETDTHLSFPAIYREGEKIYVHPENSASEKSTIYCYDQKQDRLVDPVVLVQEPLTDAVIIKEGNGFFMYSTMLPFNSGPELHIYQSESLTTPFKECDRMIFEKGKARMAGSFLRTSNGMIRPAQDCTNDYGEAVFFFHNNNIVGEIRPDKKGRFAGVHTFNVYGDTFVIDLKRYCHLETRNFIKKLLRKP